MIFSERMAKSKDLRLGADGNSPRVSEGTKRRIEGQSE